NPGGPPTGQWPRRLRLSDQSRHRRNDPGRRRSRLPRRSERRAVWRVLSVGVEFAGCERRAWLAHSFHASWRRISPTNCHDGTVHRLKCEPNSLAPVFKELAKRAAGGNSEGRIWWRTMPSEALTTD